MISQLKRGVIIINTASRDLLDEKALAEALKKGFIDSYALEMDKTTLVPELLVDDLVTTIKWYVDLLGFKLVFQSPENGEPSFARIGRGSAQIMLFRRQEVAQEIPNFAHLPVGGSLALYLTVDDIHPIWEKVKNNTKII